MHSCMPEYLFAGIHNEKGYLIKNTIIMRERRLRWFGHKERSSGAVRTACDIQIEGRRGAGRPKLTWKILTEKDCRV